MDKAELEKYGFSEIDDEIITPNDLFLIEHYEKLFYMTPIELAQAINDMGEDDLIRFNNAARGPGFNAELMREKIDRMTKYTTVNPAIFGEAVVRSGILQAGFFDTLKEMYGDNTRPRPSIVSILFSSYPVFREHFLKLKSAGIIGEKENGLEWNRDKIAIAEYFDHLECIDRNRRWRVVEKVFGYENLCQYLYTHRERQSGKPSKHFEEIKELLGLE
jgi:hypothetical protein